MVTDLSIKHAGKALSSAEEKFLKLPFRRAGQPGSCNTLDGNRIGGIGRNGSPQRSMLSTAARAQKGSSAPRSPARRGRGDPFV
jgi:hypothetical protein